MTSNESFDKDVFFLLYPAYQRLVHFTLHSCAF